MPTATNRERNGNRWLRWAESETMSFRARHQFTTGQSKWLCKRCDLPRRLHEATRDRKEYYRQREKTRKRPSNRDCIIGIDGEGKGRNPHVYTYLAAADENGTTWATAWNPDGLTTEQCFDFVLSLPHRVLCFGFAFMYDLTKIVQGMPSQLIYDLVREKRRAKLVEGKVRYRPIYWRGYKLNYMNRKLTISKGKRHVAIWDVFAFFQAKFTNALIDWQIADKEKLERMEEMKAKRAKFDKMSPTEIMEYCNEECRYLARLGRRLVDAHAEAGIPLKSFFGAGSTASSLLERLDIQDKRGEFPESMRIALASAFFGGRFENSRVGPVSGPIYDYDISSAYPYHATLLPCLLCGKWRHTRGYGKGTVSVVRWESDGQGDTWGPLPVRDAKGSIRFPLGGAGGWAWHKEFEAAQRLNPTVRALESWVYTTKCKHKPFEALPTYYRERIKLGKEAKGITIKLGLNSVYGKLAQSRGFNPRFQSWIWAGLITSGCRAQLLDAMCAAPKLSDILAVATDGIKSLSKLDLPKPTDTGTSDLAKPLGGWEETVLEQGAFFVRPGIFFPLNPSEEQVKKVRARGLGRKVLYEQHAKVVKAWEQRKRKITLRGVQRFIGAKSGITMHRGKAKRSKLYGEWINQKIAVSFHPEPKRERSLKGGHLKPWKYLDYVSEPYKAAIMSPEAVLLALATQIAEEQPNADFTDVDVGELDG